MERNQSETTRSRPGSTDLPAAPHAADASATLPAADQQHERRRTADTSEGRPGSGELLHARTAQADREAAATTATAGLPAGHPERSAAAAVRPTERLQPVASVQRPDHLHLDARLGVRLARDAVQPGDELATAATADPAAGEHANELRRQQPDEQLPETRQPESQR